MRTAKRIVIAGLFIICFAPAFSQTASAPAASRNCYGEWLNTFRSRGAQSVTDGTHEVIITIRGVDANHCFMGKAEVAGGKLKFPLWIQKQDGSYDVFASTGKKIDPAFVTTMSEDEMLTITDGMSIIFRLTDQESGRLFFFDALNPKPKGNKVAPPPSALVK